MQLLLHEFLGSFSILDAFGLLVELMRLFWVDLQLVLHDYLGYHVFAMKAFLILVVQEEDGAGFLHLYIEVFNSCKQFDLEFMIFPIESDATL